MPLCHVEEAKIADEGVTMG